MALIAFRPKWILRFLEFWAAVSFIAFATPASAQTQFVQKIQLTTRDTFALNMAEARLAFKENPVRLVWGQANITYNLRTPWTDLLGLSCGNLVEVEVMFQGSKKIMAFNPRWVERVYVDKTTKKTSILMLQSAQVFVTTGTYQVVSALLGKCSDGSSGNCKDIGYWESDEAARAAGLRYGRHYLLSAANVYGGAMALTRYESEASWMAESFSDDSSGLAFGKHYILDEANLYGHVDGTLKIRVDGWANFSIDKCEIMPTEGLPIFASHEAAYAAKIAPGEFYVLALGNLYGQPRVVVRVPFGFSPTPPVP